MTERDREVVATHYLERDRKRDGEKERGDGILAVLSLTLLSTHKLYTLEDHFTLHVTIITSHMTETSQH